MNLLQKKQSFLLFFLAYFCMFNPLLFPMHAEEPVLVSKKKKKRKELHPQQADICPICQMDLDFNLKNKATAEACMIYQACMHPAHICCTVALVDHAKNEYELDEIRCPLCRKDIEEAQLERIYPGFKKIRKEQAGLFY